MSSGLVPTIKQIAMEAVEASKPCDWTTAEVVTVSPLSVRLNPQLILPKEFIRIGNSMKNKIFNVGDIVILLRRSGGQEFLLIDTIGGE